MEIARINKEMEDEAAEKNRQWIASAEWAELREKETATARLQRSAEKNGAPKKRIPQMHRGEKFKVDKKITRSKNMRGMDAWRYVKRCY
jgi:hypothetical protein